MGNGNILLSIRTSIRSADFASIRSLGLMIAGVGRAIRGVVEDQREWSLVSRALTTDITRADKSTRGYIDTLELMRGAVKLQNASLHLSAQQYEAIAKVATSYAQTAGTDVTAEMDRLTEAIAKGQSRALKQYGVDLQNSEDLLAAQAEGLEKISAIAQHVTIDVGSMSDELYALNNNVGTFTSLLVESVSAGGAFGEWISDANTELAELNANVMDGRNFWTEWGAAAAEVFVQMQADIHTSLGHVSVFNDELIQAIEHAREFSAARDRWTAGAAKGGRARATFGGAEARLAEIAGQGAYSSADVAAADAAVREMEAQYAAAVRAAEGQAESFIQAAGRVEGATIDALRSTTDETLRLEQRLNAARAWRSEIERRSRLAPGGGGRGGGRAPRPEQPTGWQALSAEELLSPGALPDRASIEGLGIEGLVAEESPAVAFLRAQTEAADVGARSASAWRDAWLDALTTIQLETFAVASAFGLLEAATKTAIQTAILEADGVGEAVRMVLAQRGAGIAAEAGWQALLETARGFQALANPFTAFLAQGHFLAAAKFTGVAAAAGIGAGALARSGGGGGGGSGRTSAISGGGGTAAAGAISAGDYSGAGGGGGTREINVTITGDAAAFVDVAVEAAERKAAQGRPTLAVVRR